jgi:uncharacterized protein (DUF2132 family)
MGMRAEIAKGGKWGIIRGNMNQPHSKDPLHGVTLQAIVTRLVDHFGWEGLGRIIDIRCFNLDPSVSSSLKFLRKTPWARKKVEELYLAVLQQETERDEMTKPE